ncbi:hypothetical protein M0R01_03605 [bacterium]|nr:hypothetical protein [bacterium]
MCVIIYKHSKAKLPDRDKLRLAASENPDGVGLAYTHNNKVIIKKGINLKQLFDMESLLSDKTVIYHFRIATSGIKTSKNQCHPFPLSGNFEDLEKLETSCNTAIAHNGHLIGYYSDRYSDTQVFIKTVLNGFVFNDIYYNQKIKLLFESTIDGDRFIFMNKDGRIVKFGTWFKHEGIWYSNNSMFKYNYKTTVIKSSHNENVNNYIHHRSCATCGTELHAADGVAFSSIINDHVCLHCNSILIKMQRAKTNDIKVYQCESCKKYKKDVYREPKSGSMMCMDCWSSYNVAHGSKVESTGSCGICNHEFQVLYYNSLVKKMICLTCWINKDIIKGQMLKNEIATKSNEKGKEDCECLKEDQLTIVSAD